MVNFLNNTQQFSFLLDTDNLATGKNAYPHLACCSTSENTSYWHHNCSQTAANNSNWCRVDLGSDHVSVSEVLVFDGRSQALGHRSKNFILTLGERFDKRHE